MRVSLSLAPLCAIITHKAALRAVTQTLRCTATQFDAGAETSFNSKQQGWKAGSAMKEQVNSLHGETLHGDHDCS